ncbi:DinB family protein [Bacteroides sp. UBA939]|uniref:DinB family protein n=1 Tax=Bacteroides sp. UBA939 TaxID=1946092 RepID=UPI0025BDD99D|nr:DinB family protein [Bacteroides sp. UBA939]
MQENNFRHITDGIAKVIETEESLLRDLPVEVITLRRNRQNRTIKQILGHLVDSASNNHQRMVRLQYSKDLLFFPDYRQDNDLWISLQDYQNADWANLIQLWKFYNLHIIQVIKSVDALKLDSYWCDFEGTKVTLKEMIEGYLEHLNLHIKEIHELVGNTLLSVQGNI